MKSLMKSFRKNCVSDYSSVQRNKIVDSFKLTAAKFLIHLFIKFTYFCADDIATLKKKILLKDKKPLTTIKTSSKHKKNL